MFGCFTAQRHLDNRVTFKNVVIVTDVRGHTCEMAGHLVEKCKEYVDNLPSVTKVWLFSDCGKHFRILEFVGYVYKSWCEALSATILLCFFIERHGKGRVDALFALFTRWLKNLPGVSECFSGSRKSLLLPCRAQLPKPTLQTRRVLRTLFSISVLRKSHRSSGDWRHRRLSLKRRTASK